MQFLRETALGEVDRRHPDYIRWVQRSLNQLTGAGLVVDGIRGRRTSSAIRNFQKRHGLAVDGIVGKRTEAALIAAGAPSPRPPAPTRGPISPPASPGGSPQGPFGALTITASPQLQFRYAFTAEDVLWIARMITGEAGGRNDRNNQAVIWAMFNRYAFFTHRNYATFTRFIRAYSTPLQPYLVNCSVVRHYLNDPRFQRLGGTVNNKDCPDLPRGQLQRHIRLQGTPWNRLPAGARALAEGAVKGLIPNPICTATEFASTFILYKRSHGNSPTPEEWRRFTTQFKNSKHFQWIGEIAGLDQRKNAFFTRTLRIPGSSQSYADLPCNTVRVIPSP